jgi:hypothetical protein
MIVAGSVACLAFSAFLQFRGYANLDDSRRLRGLMLLGAGYLTMVGGMVGFLTASGAV